jgi:DMSO/TMAO reductase YedYZ molybdopterin-dependent catalytic subunit
LKHLVFKASLLVLIFALVLPGLFVAFAQTTSNNSTTNANAGYTLTIDGAVATPLTLSLTDIEAMPQASVNSLLWCEGIVITGGIWLGVQISTLLQAANYYPRSTTLEFYASDGYNINISVEAALQNNFIIAYELNGQPLPETLRLILPNDEGPYWIAMITEMRVTNSGNYDCEPPTDDSVAVPPPSVEPTLSPEPTITPTLTSIATTSTQPSVTPQPTQTPNLNSTSPMTSLPPSIAPTPSSTPQPSASPITSDNETGSPATAPPMGEQLSKPVTSSISSSSVNINVALPFATIVALVAVVLVVIFARRKRIQLT